MVSRSCFRWERRLEADLATAAGVVVVVEVEEASASEGDMATVGVALTMAFLEGILLLAVTVVVVPWRLAAGLGSPMVDGQSGQTGQPERGEGGRGEGEEGVQGRAAGSLFQHRLY